MSFSEALASENSSQEVLFLREQLQGLLEAYKEPTKAPRWTAKKRKEVADAGPIHVVIPDTQSKPGVPNDHLAWIGQYIADKFSGRDTTVIHLGDHWDMPSLSSYDKGKKAMEGRRYLADVVAGNRAFALLDDPIAAATAKTGWTPRKVLLRGNHENRILRATELDPQLDGLLSMDALDGRDWEVHDFLEVVDIDGVLYSHYFYNPMNGRPYGGANVETRLKTIGHSFTMGHQQTLQYGLRFINGVSQHGLVCGAAYQHEEDYLGPQGNAHWRGIVVCHNVRDGSYSPMFVPLDYLCRRYEGRPLAEHEGLEL